MNRQKHLDGSCSISQCDSRTGSISITVHLQLIARPANRCLFISRPLVRHLLAVVQAKHHLSNAGRHSAFALERFDRVQHESSSSSSSARVYDFPGFKVPPSFSITRMVACVFGRFLLCFFSFYRISNQFARFMCRHTSFFLSAFQNTFL